MVLLVPENDGACTGLNGCTARKTKVLVLVWCNKARGDREQDLWRYRLSEGCIKQRYDKRSGYGCLSKKCELWEHEAVTFAVSCTVAKLSDIQSENAGFETYWLSPPTSNQQYSTVLTYSMMQSPSWAADWLAASQEIPRISRTRRFITALTSVRHLSLSWASPVQSTCPHPTSWSTVLYY
jgi:hypothetical protein